MTRKANKTTTAWRKRYAVHPHGQVLLARGKGKKHNGTMLHQLHLNGKWRWQPIQGLILVDTEAQLAALRLQGIPVSKEPRWATYSS